MVKGCVKELIKFFKDHRWNKEMMEKKKHILSEKDNIKTPYTRTFIPVWENKAFHVNISTKDFDEMVEKSPFGYEAISNIHQSCF